MPGRRLFIVPFWEWEKNPRLQADEFIRVLDGGFTGLLVEKVPQNGGNGQVGRDDES